MTEPDQINLDDHLRSRHARVALEHAPALAEDLLDLATPADGRTDRGERVVDARIPLLSRPFDDADHLYALLIEWVTYWAERLGVPAPSVIEARRRRRVLDDDGRPVLPEVPWDDPSLVVGFPSGGSLGMTPIRVRALTAVLTTWLLTIHEHPALVVDRVSGELSDVARIYFDDIAAATWTIRCRYGLTAGGRMQETAARECPTCGRQAVRVTYFEPSKPAAIDAPIGPGQVGYPMETAEALGKLPLWHLSRDERIWEATRAAFGVSIRCQHCLETIDARPAYRKTTGIITWAREHGVPVPKPGVPFPAEVRAEYEAAIRPDALDERDAARDWIAAWLS